MDRGKLTPLTHNQREGIMIAQEIRSTFWFLVGLAVAVSALLLTA